jgi:group I intron endonuclease
LSGCWSVLRPWVLLIFHFHNIFISRVVKSTRFFYGKGIYKLTNIVNNKVYIGQSKKLNNREWCHFYRLKRGEHHNEILQRSYNKHGEINFVFEILEYTENLNERESYWLDEYGGVMSKDTYNMKDPLTNEYCDYTKKKVRRILLGNKNPNYGNTWSEEQKKRQSEKYKGLTWEDRYGEEKSKEIKEKLSKSQKGRQHSEETKEKIRQHNVGENNPMYGMGHKQMGENNPMYGKKSSKRKPILQLDKLGNIIKEFECLSDVSEDGFHIGNVGTCARGKQKTSGGYRWVYKEDFSQVG